MPASSRQQRAPASRAGRNACVPVATYPILNLAVSYGIVDSVACGRRPSAMPTPTQKATVAGGHTGTRSLSERLVANEEVQVLGAALGAQMAGGPRAAREIRRLLGHRWPPRAAAPPSSSANRASSSSSAGGTALCCDGGRKHPRRRVIAGETCDRIRNPRPTSVSPQTAGDGRMEGRNPPSFEKPVPLLVRGC